MVLLTIATFLILLAGLLTIFLLVREYRREKAKVQDQIQRYLEWTDSELPGELAPMLVGVSNILSSRLVFHIKQNLLGELGGQVKQERALERAVGVAVASGGNPTIEAILNSDTVKAVTKGKPWLLQVATELIGKALPGSKDNPPTKRANWPARRSMTLGGF